MDTLSRPQHALYRPTRNYGGGFFKQTAKQKIEFGLVYEADIAENELRERRFPDGNQILNKISSIWNLPASVISGMVPTLTVRGLDSFLMTCADAATMNEVLNKMPNVALDGKSFIGRLAEPDSYSFKPRRVKVFIYGAPLTMSAEVLKSRLSQFGDIDSEIDFDYYEPPWERVSNGNRVIYFKNIYPSAGLPLVLWINGVRIKFRHRGQERNWDERAKLEAADQQRRNRMFPWAESETSYQSPQHNRGDEQRATEMNVEAVINRARDPGQDVNVIRTTNGHHPSKQEQTICQ